MSYAMTLFFCFLVWPDRRSTKTNILYIFGSNLFAVLNLPLVLPSFVLCAFEVSWRLPGFCHSWKEAEQVWKTLWGGRSSQSSSTWPMWNLIPGSLGDPASPKRFRASAECFKLLFVPFLIFLCATDCSAETGTLGVCLRVCTAGCLLQFTASFWGSADDR